jgi:hypothetical protein
LSAIIHSTPTPQHHQSSDDDIDLLGLLQSVFKTWKVWLVSMIVISIIFLGIQAFKVLIKDSDETVFSKPLRLTFAGAHKQVFPSGAKFNYSDIVAPAVVQQAFDRNKLDNFGLNIADLQGGLTATPYAPTYPLIIERYNKLMADKKLTPDHIAELKKQLEKELEQATTGEVLISWRLSEQSIPKSVAEKVLNDIPAIWADQAIKEKGVFEINANLATANSLNAKLILNEEILVASDILTEKLSLLKINIEELSKFEGAQTITDPQTGMRLIDLNNAIDDLNNYGIRNFTAPIHIYGLTSTPELSSYYYMDKLNNLKIKLTSLQSQANAVKESLTSYNKNDQASSLINSNGNNSPALMTQLGSDMLDKLVSLSSDADREKYKQQLNTKWLAFTKDIAETQSKITATELIVKALEKTSSQSAKISAEHAKYLARAKAKLPEILQQITDYFAVSERIAKQLRAETVGIKEQLYIPITHTIMENSESFDIKGMIISWLALLFLTSILVVPGFMIRNALREKTQ